MKQWWEIESSDLPGSIPRVRAVAYYRHSAQDRQENSIPIQRGQVRELLSYKLSSSTAITQQEANAS